MIAAEDAGRRVRLVVGVDGEVERIKRYLQAIQVVLEDAEEKRMTDQLIRLWLDGLKEETYRIMDVLDVWNTALLKSRIDGVGKSTSDLKTKVRSLVDSCFNVPGLTVRRYDMATSIKRISARLDIIYREKDRYNLLQRPDRQLPRRVETSSFDIDVSKLYGRGEIKEKIVNSLLYETRGELETGSCDNHITTISLVGMGGIGKTALAQSVYHDERVKQQFKRIWVCVSHDFNERNFAKAVIIGLEGLNRDAVYTFDSLPMEELLKRICTSIEGLKCLFVVDDVWTDDRQRWERLLRTFKYASQGSRILLTTRIARVANIMDSRVYHLPPLPDQDCWMILSQLAFVGRREEECNRLNDIGWRLSSRCNGLPLAAKILGSMLKFKNSRAEWEDILNSQLWQLEDMAVFGPIKLSYLELPPPMRECYKYCSIFPRDHTYWRTDVIYHWMAQGYLGDVIYHWM